MRFFSRIAGRRRGPRCQHLLLLLFLTLVGCDEVPVAEKLSLPEANEVVAVLSAVGIPADVQSERGPSAGYSVDVRRARFAEAASVLRERGLPHPRRDTFQEIIEPKGFLPAGRGLESLRIDFALAVQLEELVSNLPAVERIRAIVRSNARTPGERARVTVVIRERRGQFVDRETVTKLVGNVVPGVSPEDVNVVIEQAPAEPTLRGVNGVEASDGEFVSIPLVQFLRFRVAEGDYSGLTLMFVGLLLLVGALGSFLGYWWGRYEHMRSGSRGPGGGGTLPRVLSGARPARERQLPEGP